MAAPEGLKISKTMAKKLPAHEKENVEDSINKLWSKSKGKCALCEYPLNSQDPKSIEIDHIVPEALNGPTKLSNLQLTHKKCNRSKGKLPTNIATPLIRFEEWCRREENPSFDDVLSKFNIKPKPIEVKWNNDVPTLKFGNKSFTGSQAIVDIPSGLRYFYCEVDIQYIFNDSDVQPRMIQHDHVRKLALNINKGPLHEPSNCRMLHQGGDTYVLKQFDGQHKTTSQLVIGRQTVQMKLYVDATVAQTNKLVLTIQKEISKKPLTTSDTVAKLSDVVKAALNRYKVEPPQIRTEKGFINSLTKDEGKIIKPKFLEDLRGQILNDDENSLYPYYQKSNDKSNPMPLKDNKVMRFLIKPLVYSDLLETNMDNLDEYFRDEERKNVLFFLEKFYELAIKDKWNGPSATKVSQKRISNLCQQASMKIWMNIFDSMARTIIKSKHSVSPFCREWDDDDRLSCLKILQAIIENEIWDTEDQDILGVINTNQAGLLEEKIRDILNQFVVFQAYQILTLED